MQQQSLGATVFTDGSTARMDREAAPHGSALSDSSMSKTLTGKKGIRAFLLQHIGEIVTTEQVRDASGNQVQYSRRLRELRDEEGWRIQSHRDSTDLRPGQYRLVEQPPEQPPIQLTRRISRSCELKCLTGTEAPAKCVARPQATVMTKDGPLSCRSATSQRRA